MITHLKKGSSSFQNRRNTCFLRFQINDFFNIVIGGASLNLVERRKQEARGRLTFFLDLVDEVDKVDKSVRVLMGAFSLLDLR